MKRTFDPPPPEQDVQAEVAHAATVLLDVAHRQWNRHPDLRRMGVPFVLTRGYANLEGDELNANLPDPAKVWAALQELLPRNVVLRVEPYVPGSGGQTAFLTWRD